MLLKTRIMLKSSCIRRCFSYNQGQYVDNVRQYFYFINHEGQLFLDNVRIKNFTSCFKDVKFLNFFYARLGLNSTGQYQQEFPYVSLCASEQNFVRCDDRPLVFTQVDTDRNCLHIGHCLKKVEFQPEKLCMFENGRLYHPAPLDRYGLVRSKIADEMYKFFEFDSNNNPIHFNWQGRRLTLTNSLKEFDKT